MRNIVRLVGLVSAVVVLAMLTCVAHAAFMPLSKGSQGEAVVELQNRLNELGYSVGTADGDFGGKTEKAIQQFQQDNGLQVTGTLNETTYNALFMGDAGSENESALPNSLYLVHGDDGYGFINYEGTVIINCVWEEAFPFQEGLSRVKRDGLYGFIDTAGNEVIMCQWSDASDFKEGIASVSFEGENEWGAINTSGDQIIPCEYYHISPCSEGIIVACEYETTYNGGTKYQHSYTAFSSNGKSLFNWKTDWSSYEDDFDHTFSSGLLDASFVEYATGKNSWRYTGGVYLNTKGKIAFEVPEGMYGGDFSEGLTSVMRGGDYSFGYMDTDCNMVLDYEWERAGLFQDGIAPVQNHNEKYGYIDRSGKEVIPCIYNNMFWGFSDGLCAVQNDMEKWGFINKSGELVVDYLYDEVEQYRDGLALCRVNGEKIYIDKDGNEVFNFEI